MSLARRVSEILISQKINRVNLDLKKKKSLAERVLILTVQILARGGIEFN